MTAAFRLIVHRRTGGTGSSGTDAKESVWSSFASAMESPKSDRHADSGHKRYARPRGRRGRAFQPHLLWAAKAQLRWRSRLPMVETPIDPRQSCGPRCRRLRQNQRRIRCRRCRSPTPRVPIKPASPRTGAGMTASQNGDLDLAAARFEAKVATYETRAGR
jgi:hypothetical protein